MASTTAISADEVIAQLRAHEAELREAGICRLSLFGSVARGDAEPDSDVDLAAEFDQAARMDLFRLIELERRLAEILRHPVDLLAEPVAKERFRRNINRDRQDVF